MTIRIAALAAAALALAAPQADAAQNITRRAPLGADGSVYVSNVQGRVEVTAWDRNEVELTAVLESDEDKLEFTASGKEIRIEVDRPDNRHYRNRDDDAILTVKIPRGARLSTETVSADTTVTGARGRQSLDTVSGTIRTEAYDADVSVSTVSGDGTIAGTGGKASITAHSVSGTLNVQNVRGSLDGEVVSGSLTADVAAADLVRAESVSGDVILKVALAPNARVELETVSGELSLDLKAPVNAEFDIESFSGDIESCFSAKSRDTSKYGPGSELRFTEGNGGARVEIESLSGDIRICGR